MADSSQEFHLLMQRVREGSEEASQELLNRYGEHILRVVRRKLHRKLRSKFDSLDFVQAVWASFFAAVPEKYQFQDPQALAAFLVTLAQNKVVDAVRQRLQTQKYNVNRERSLEGSASCGEEQLIAHQPTPSQVASANEQWERLIRDLPDRFRNVINLLRQGHTQREIAQQMGIDEKTVRRILQKLRVESLS